MTQPPVSKPTSPFDESPERNDAVPVGGLSSASNFETVDKNQALDALSIDEWSVIMRHIWFGFLFLPSAIWLALAICSLIATREFVSLMDLIDVGLLFVIPATIFSAVVGLVCAALAIWIVIVADLTLRPSLSPSLIGAVTGGVATVGPLVIWSPGLISSINYSVSAYQIMVMVLALVVATAVGQYAGGVGGLRAGWKYPRERTKASRGKGNFSIRQILVSSVLLAMFLTFVRLADLLTMEFATVFGISILIHVLTLLFGSNFWPNFAQGRIQRWEANQTT